MKRRLKFGDARMARVELPVPYQGRKIVLGQVEPGDACGPTGPKATIRLCQKRLRAPLARVSDHRGVCQFMRGMGDADRESFYVLHLDVRHLVTGVEEVAKGSLTGVEVHPREVFKSAILGNAAALIIAHNHPSSEASPSGEDIKLTNRLAEAGRMLGIPILDHVVIGGTECRSMREMGVGGLGRARRR